MLRSIRVPLIPLAAILIVIGSGCESLFVLTYISEIE